MMIDDVNAAEVPNEILNADREDTAVDNVTLARLLEEVRKDEPSEPHAYNRMHNRHNR